MVENSAKYFDDGIEQLLEKLNSKETLLVTAEKNEIMLRLLSQVTFKLLQIESFEDTLNFTSLFISKFLSNSVVLSLTNNLNISLMLNNIAGLSEKQLSDINNILNEELYKKEFCPQPEDLTKFYRNKLTEVDKEDLKKITDYFTTGSLKEVIQYLEINKIYSIGFAHKNTLYAVFTILSKKDISDLEKTVVETLVNSVSAALVRFKSVEAVKYDGKIVDAIIDNAPDIITIIDTNGIIKFLNRVEPGFVREDFYGKSIFELAPDTFLSDAIAEFDRAKREKITVQYLSLFKKFNQNSYYLNRLSLLDPSDSNSDAIVFSTNITEGYISNQEKENLFELSDDLICVVDFNKRFKLLSPSWERRLGWSLEELKAKEWTEFVHPDDVKRSVDNEYVISNGKFRSKLTNRFLHKDGSYRWLSWDSIGDIENEVIYVVARDITEQQKFQDKLKLSEEKYRSVFINDTFAMSLIDIDTTQILEVNNAFLKMYKYTIDDDITKLSLYDLTTDVESSKSAIGEGLASGSIFVPLRYHKKSDGTIFPVELSAGHFIWNGKKVANIIARDISDRVKFERALKGSERRLAYAAKIGQIGYIEIDLEKNRTIWSQSFYDIIGIERTGSVPPVQVFEKNIHSNDKANFDNVYQSAITGNHSEADFRYSKPDGKEIIIRIKYEPILNEHGRVIKLFSVCQDITKNVQTEQEIKRLLYAVTQSSSMIIITGFKGYIEFVNPKFCQVTGFDENEVLGRCLSDLLKFEELNYEEYKTVKYNIINAIDWRGELLGERKTGERFWTSTSISSVRDKNGEIINQIVISDDITGDKEVMSKLKEALDQAEESDKLKSSLLANISHEFRTPLTGILGLSQILLETLENVSQIDYAKKINDSGKRLMITLNSILDLSELESNAVVLELKEENIYNKLDLLHKHYLPFAHKKGLYFGVEIKNRNLVSIIDEKLFKIVLSNIIDNAIKYTSYGGVMLTVDGCEIDENTYAKISISDTGIGIEQDNYEVIFQEFRQVSEGKGRSYEGCGLGLTVARKMVKLMNGKIEVESNLGMGSVFHLYLPAKNLLYPVYIDEVENSISVENDLVNNEQKKIVPSVLLVEDNYINKIVAEEYIKDIVNLDYAASGDLAIEKCLSQTYDIVLMDINLGVGIDGVETFKKIRQIKGFEKTYFVAVTGYAMSADKERFLNEGFSHYLPKPFEQNELEEIIYDIIGKIEV